MSSLRKTVVVCYSKEPQGGFLTFFKSFSLLEKKFRNETLTLRTTLRHLFEYMVAQLSNMGWRFESQIKKSPNNLSRLLQSKSGALTFFCLDVKSLIIVAMIQVVAQRRDRLIYRMGIHIEPAIRDNHFGPVRWFLLWIFPICLRRCHCIIFTSKGLCDYYCRKYSLHAKNKPVVIYNGIYPHTTMVKKPDSKNTKTHILSMGRIDKQKDFLTIIKALQILFSRGDNIDLTIFGKGAEKSRLRQYISVNSLAPYIKIKNWNKKIVRRIREYDLFIYSGIYEGFGYVVLEALSEGVPVIATDTPYGPGEIIGGSMMGKCGYVVPIGNPQIMAERIQAFLMKSPQGKKEMSRWCRRRSRFFSEGKMLQAYESILYA